MSEDEDLGQVIMVYVKVVPEDNVVILKDLVGDKMELTDGEDNADDDDKSKMTASCQSI